MTALSPSPNILVFSGTPQLAELTRQAVGNSAIVGYAPNREAVLAQVRTLRPAIIVLENTPGVSGLKLCRELRDGWISRHSSLLLIEPSPASDYYRIMDDICIETVVGEYITSGFMGIMVNSTGFPAALKSKIRIILAGRANRLKAAIQSPDQFCIIWEQIPGLGAFEIRQEQVIANAGIAAASGKVCAISVTDNPGGNPAIATEILSAEIRKLGVEPLVHVAFRDRSRNQAESLLYQLAAMDINNLLVLSGDYPANNSFRGTSRPVFDLDSVNGLQLISQMNRGMEHRIMHRTTTLAPTCFFNGVAFSPFKKTEAEVLGQYYKLQKKIASGADFIITQVGYDIRKLHELQLWLQRHGYNIPVIVSIYILSPGTAKSMHDNRVPGCVVTDRLLAQVQAEAAASDRGHAAQLERAARLYAVVKGLGFKGVSFSGPNVPYASLEYVTSRGSTLAADWTELVPDFFYPQTGGFYYFTRDSANGLNTATPAVRRQQPAHPPLYYFSALVHSAIFAPRSPLFKFMRLLARWADSSRVSRRLLGSFEFLAKVVFYNCLNCGDCALYDTAYLCPVSQCPKNQRNGPCGGSFNGWCEVYPGTRQCVWVRAYLRLKARHREDSIGGYIVPPNDWQLWQTSSWLNYFLGRDYLSQRLHIIKPAKTPEIES